MKKLLLIALSSFILFACSSSPSDKVSAKIIDKEAYELGEQHAREAITLVDDEPALQELLLDVRARQTNIRMNLGAQAAADYERGFTRFIKANSDTLSKIIL